MSQTSAAPKAAALSGGLSYRQKVRLTQALVIIVLILLAELVPHISNVDKELFPPPSQILMSMGEVLAEGPIRMAILTLLLELLVAFALSIVLGMAIGYLVGSIVAVEMITLPILLLIYSIPQVTILPLFVLYFGPGFGSKVAFGVSHGMFPIALSIVAGLNQARANPIYARWASSLGAGWGQRLRRVQLPQAVGAILVGLRLAMSTTLLGVLLADVYISSSGVGYFTRLFTETLQGPKLFALIVVIAVLAIVINAFVTRLEHLSSRWKRS